MGCWVVGWGGLVLVFCCLWFGGLGFVNLLVMGFGLLFAYVDWV